MASTMDDPAINLPHGCKFNPKDEDLLEYYLKPKLHGQKLPCNIVKEKRIYGPGANPWLVFDDSSTEWISSGKFEKTVYVFTRSKKEATVIKHSQTDPRTKKKKSFGMGRKHCVKKAGCGAWHGGGGCREIKKGGKVVGFKRLMVFEINDVSSLGDGVELENVGFWKMNEYYLCENQGNAEFVLCQITVDASKNAKVVSVCPRIVSSCGDMRPQDDHKLINELESDCDLPVSTIYPSNSLSGDDLLISPRNLNKGLLEDHDNGGNPADEEQVYKQGCLASSIIGFWTWMVSLKIFPEV